VYTSLSRQGKIYMQRYCLTNRPGSVIRSNHNTFSDQCHTHVNCYAQCGESPYGNEIRTGDTIIVRGVRVDLYDKLRGLPSGTKKVQVHAQTVILTRRLDIAFDLEISARQVFFPTGAQLRKNNQVISTCVQTVLYPECKSRRPMYLRSYYGVAYVDIYAQAIHSGDRCRTGRVLVNLPRQDPQALRQAMACSQVLRMYSSNGYNQAADNILYHVIAVSNDQSAFASKQEAAAINSQASQLRGELKLQAQAGQRYLPVLSQKAYTNILGLYADMFTTYSQKYTTAFNARATAETRRRDLKAMVDISSKNVQVQRTKADHAASSLQQSTLALKKLKVEFDKANVALEKAQVELDKGIEAYKRKQIMKAVFGFINIIGQLFKAVSQIVVGAVTGNPAMIVGGVGDLISAIADLAILIQETIDLANTIKSMTALSDSMSMVTASLKVPENSQEILQSVDEAADQRVKIVVWENVKNKADIQLGSGTITEIAGSDLFRNALADLAVHGKALSEEVINHADLMRNYIVATMAYDVAKAKYARLNALMNAAANSVSNELLAEASAQISDVQIGAIKTMVDYCNTKFYYNFQECSPEFRFKLSDSLHQLQVKVARMARAQLESAVSFGSSPPTYFKGIHVLKDLDTRRCTSPARCPITMLKRDRRLQFSVDFSSPGLKAHQRARVREIRLFLKGLHFTRNDRQTLQIRLTNSGVLRDSYKNKKYTFWSIGRELMSTFDYKNHIFTTKACKHKDIGDILFDITPFGEWSLEILTPAADCNLSGVTQLEMYFLGTSIVNRNVVNNNPHDLYFSHYGFKKISTGCSTKKRRKKRFIEMILQQ